MTQSKILIVDDNIFNIVTLQTILEMQFGIKGDKAMNGQDALNKVKARLNTCKCVRKNSNYKLIFMDCNMPIMDGFQATVEIRRLEQSLPEMGRIFIVALTAYTTDNFKVKCFEHGMDSYLTKPVNSEQLHNILQQII